MNSLNILYRKIPVRNLYTASINRSLDFYTIPYHEQYESRDNENINNSVSEEFMNNLDELVIDENLEKEGIECSICLDKFKIGDKYIKLPCKDHPHFFHCLFNMNCDGFCLRL